MPAFTIVPYERKFADAVKACALSAWTFTYGKIFSPQEIQQHVDRFYSEESTLAAEDLISRELLHYTVALDEAGQLAGFQASSINMLHAELTRLYVLPQRIGCGLGSTLLSESEAFFRKTGFKSYQVKVHRYNTIGQRFYERKGFYFLGQDNADHFLLKKDLQFIPEV